MAANVFEAEDFSNLTHWQSLAWHGAPRSLENLGGYGIASRLDWLLILLLFGLGSGVVTMVGAATGAGDHARARRVAWTAVLLASVPAGASHRAAGG